MNININILQDIVFTWKNHPMSRGDRGHPTRIPQRKQ